MSRENEEKVIADIKCDELWLRELVANHPAPQEPSMEHLKLRVRIAVHERFVDFGQAPQISQTAVSAIRRSIRRRLVREMATGNPAARSMRSWYRWATAGLAAAAMIVILVTPEVRRRPASEATAPAPGPLVSDDADLLSETAGTAYDREILAIESALQELEDVAGASLFSSIGQQTSEGGAEDNGGGVGRRGNTGSAGFDA
jgi:hypothetical protein